MINIKNHIQLLMDKYYLNNLYKKYIFLSITSTLVKESFYWCLLLFSTIVKEEPSKMPFYSIMLLGILGVNIPLERYFEHTRAMFLEEIKLANNKHFNDMVINMPKKDILNFDLINYYNILDHLNDNIHEYINNEKIKYDIPIRCITLVIIAMNKNFILLIGLFIVYFSIIIVMSENKLVKETELTNKYFHYDNEVRNYIVNSKNFIMNNEFNDRHHYNNFTMFEHVNSDLLELTNDLDMKINITMYIFIIIVIWLKRKDIEPSDFLYYFLIVYDIEFVSDKVQDYYKNMINYNKMSERLRYLNSFGKNGKYVENITNNNLTQIVINKLLNDKPVLNITKPIVINQGDHILINGESGSGKTSILYLLKGIITPDTLDIKPSVNEIASLSYLFLSSHKSLFNGNLYDIISNYEQNPNIEMINFVVKTSKIDSIIKKLDNVYIDIEKLSGGEKMRIIIARLIYSIKKYNYSILLFDELDENLNNALAVEICNKILELFNDKIILYITHNEMVKKLFTKKINVVNGMITYQ